jgi:acetoacetyl-[acyl-carrier protein] synthase
MRLPVIVGFGGINTAGRSSFHHGYRRLVIDALTQTEADRTYQSLASVMGIDGALGAEQKQFILDHSLIRRIEGQHFDVESVPYNKRVPGTTLDDQQTSFVAKSRNLPDKIPENWAISDLGDGMVRVDIEGQSEFLVPSQRVAPVQSAGQLPTGFEPGSLYQSRNHPRGLQMTVYAASDAVGSLGIDWQTLCEKVSPDMMSVYAGSCMGQLDQNGHGGMISARLNGKRTTSKQCPFGLIEMPADFVNAYVLGSLGNTGTSVGACASFLYNLRMGIMDIQSGRARVAVIGNSEAPIVPDVMDGYSAMGALATDAELLGLDAGKGLSMADHRRACRPFSSNCGFTMAESSQYVVLFDDELAMELGANIYGATPDVFVNADGFKKSISSPGVGNYLTVGKALAAARTILGEEAVKQRSFVQAHGTSTPQNRVTESHILNETAKVFGIDQWPVGAIKAYLGHSLGVSSGDQLAATLGVWEHGLIPGIKTIDHVADDVFSEHLKLGSEHIEVGKEGMDVAILNAKGFGGNNASATVLAPHVVAKMLERKHGSAVYKNYLSANESVTETARNYDEQALKGEAKPIYKFDHNVLDGSDLDYQSEQITVPGYDQKIDLNVDSPYKDLV